MNTELQEYSMSEDEFKNMLPLLEKIIQDAKNRLFEAAEILGRMSKPQLSEVKKKFKRLIGSDHIDRLTLYGRKLMGAHLAGPERSIRASMFSKLPAAAKRVLNDPEHEVEVLTMRGVRKKKVCDLTILELNQVVDPRKGVLDASEQQKRVLSAMPVHRAKSKEVSDAEEIESIKLTDVPGVLLIVTNTGRKVRALAKQLRRWVA